MRFRPNPFVHIVILVIVAVVAITGIATHHFGIRGSRHRPGTPSPAISSISLSEQAELLSSTRELRLQGRYEEAIAALQQVTVSSDPEHAAAALLETAKDQIALGDTAHAGDTLRRIRDGYRQTAAADEAEFHLAQVEAEQGDLSAAISDLQDYRSRHQSIATYLNLQIAQYQLQRGKSSDALKTAESVAESNAIDRARVDALEQMRTIQKQRKDNQGYLEATNELMRLAKIPSYQAELRYERATVELRLGQRDAAIVDLRSVLTGYPDTGYAQNAVSDLRKLSGNNAVSDEQAALVDYQNGDYASAIEMLSRLVSTGSPSDRAWYYLALSKLGTGDSWAAAVDLTSMADRYPSSSLTPPALLTAGHIYEDRNDPSTALSVYQSLIERFGSSVEATTGRIRAGVILYQRGDYAGSIKILAPVNGDDTDSAEASFWEGKAFQQSGDLNRAKQSWIHANEADPTGYFGLRSAQLLTDGTVMATKDPPTSLDIPLTAEDAEELASWYSNSATDADQARATLQHDIGFQRMNLLFELGLSTQAGWEMSALADQFASSPVLLGTFGQLLLESGHYNEAYRVGLRLQSVADNDGLQLPRAMQRLAYPLAYPSLVQIQASAHNVDPFLFLALMRQESGYDPSATSTADARGLAQVIPSTGEELAKALRIGNFNPEMLYRPAIAVQFGALYLTDQLTHFDGQIYPALAGYNAGDGNVDQWLAADKSADPDLFVETIPFAETHDYVRIVYANYLNYLRLYR